MKYVLIVLMFHHIYHILENLHAHFQQIYNILAPDILDIYKVLHLHIQEHKLYFFLFLLYVLWFELLILHELMLFYRVQHDL